MDGPHVGSIGSVSHNASALTAYSQKNRVHVWNDTRHLLHPDGTLPDLTAAREREGK